MHAQHHQPTGTGPDAAHILATFQQRLKRADTAARWLARAADTNADLHTQLVKAIGELADLHEEVVMWRQLAAKRCSIDPSTPPPPQHYIEALRAWQHEPYRGVTVDIDGLDWTVGFACHAAADPNPERELAAWAQLVTVAREARASLAVTA